MAKELFPEIEASLLALERSVTEANEKPSKAQVIEAKKEIKTPHEFWEYVQQERDVYEGGNVTGINENAIKEISSTTEGHSELTPIDLMTDERYNKQNARLLKRIEEFEIYLKHCENLSQRLNAAVNILEGLETKHKLVSDKTNSLHETCKKLLAEQAAFDNVLSEIDAPLNYLRELDRISELFGIEIETPLSLSGRAKVHSAKEKRRPLHPDTEEFRKALARVNECIDYVENNPQFRDYKEYSTKFSLLYTKGLQLLRNYIQKSIMNLFETVKAALQINSTGQLGIEGTNQFSLLYIRFQVLAGQLKPCIVELEARSNKQEVLEELKSCHECLRNVRFELLKDIVSESQELTRREDLVTKLRMSSPYLVRLCNLEYQLFCTFFDPKCLTYTAGGEDTERTIVFAMSSFNEEDELKSSLSDKRNSSEGYAKLITSIGERFYDVTRPLIIQEKDVDKLCECIRVLEGEIIEAQIDPGGASLLPLKVVLEEILHDLQERLFYCTSLYIRDNISAFIPTSEDLNYPGKLVIAEGQSEQELMYSGWYKSLENTLMCLSKVFRCLGSTTFDELTQEAIAACVESLESASAMIAEKHSKLDADLFLVKHLLILREQITPFNSELRIKQKHLDYSPTFDAFSEFLRHSREVFAINRHNPLIELFSHGVPKIKEDELDCKKDLETRLRKACDQFILRGYEQCLLTVIPFLQRAYGMINSAEESEKSDLLEKEFAAPERVLQLLRQNADYMPKMLESLSQKMAQYLINKQTHSVLLQPIKTNVFARLTEFMTLVSTHYQECEGYFEMLELLSTLRSNVSSLEWDGTTDAAEVRSTGRKELADETANGHSEKLQNKGQQA